MVNIKFPIVVPDDITIMDRTQLINYVTSHTCDEMRPIMIDLVYNIDANVKLTQTVRAVEDKVTSALDSINEALEYLEKVVEEDEA